MPGHYPSHTHTPTVAVAAAYPSNNNNRNRLMYLLMISLVTFIVSLQLYSGYMASKNPVSDEEGGTFLANVVQGAVGVDAASASASSSSSASAQEQQQQHHSLLKEHHDKRDAPPPPPAATEEKKKTTPSTTTTTTPSTNQKENRETLCLSQPWILKHKQIQDDILSGKRPPKYMVYRPDCGYCGMCNRLNGMLGTYLAAVLTDRAFIIDWRYPGKQGWAKNTHYLDPRLIDWRAESALGGKEKGNEGFDWPEEKTWSLRGWGDSDRLVDKFASPEFLKEEIEKYEAVVFTYMGESPTLSLRQNPEAKKRAVERGIMSNATEWDEEWNEAFKGCAVRTLFKPSKTLQKFYCQTLKDSKSGEQVSVGRGVGIHVRTGDDRTWNEEYKEPTDEHFRFAKCAEGMRQAFLQDKGSDGLMAVSAAVATAAAEGGGKEGGGGGRKVDMNKWHVASDYQKVVDDLRKVHPEQIESMDAFDSAEMNATIGGDIRMHSANTFHQQFTLGPMLELIHLSNAVALIGTCRSSFSAAAGYFGLLPPELVLLKRTNFEPRYFHSKDCPEMAGVEEAEGVCKELVGKNRELVMEVLRTPPFVSCPVEGWVEEEEEEWEKEKR